MPSASPSDGRVLVELKSAWRDGTTHLLFEPIEFLYRSGGLGFIRPVEGPGVPRGVGSPQAPGPRHAP